MKNYSRNPTVFRPILASDIFVYDEEKLDHISVKTKTSKTVHVEKSNKILFARHLKTTAAESTIFIVVAHAKKSNPSIILYNKEGSSFSKQETTLDLPVETKSIASISHVPSSQTLFIISLYSAHCC